MGYYRAGWDVYGVDVIPQPQYPFWFFKADAMTFDASGFDAIHASPPCQGYSDLAKRHGKTYPTLIEPVRDKLVAAGVPYVIENVEGSPLNETSYLQVTGRNYRIENGREAMAISWMKHKLELSESVPPAYTQWIGAQLLAVVR